MAAKLQVGTARYFMWFLLTLTHVITHFHRFNINVLADQLMVEFNLSAVSLGNLAAAYSYTYLLMQIPGGLLIDRWGPRRTAFVAALFLGVGSLLFATAHSISAIFLGRLIIGFGGSVILINILKFQSAWFRENQFATMSGLAILIGSLGAVAATFPLAYIVALASWRIVFLVTGVAGVLIAFYSFLWVRDRPGQDGRSLQLPGRAEAAGGISIPAALKQVVRNRSLWVIFLVNFGFYGSFIALTGAWGVTYVMQIYNLTRQESALFMFPAILGMMLGAPVWGIISDKMGRRKLPIILAGLFFAANWVLLLTVSGGKPPLALLCLVVFNLGVGASMQTLTLTYAKELSPPALTGTATAFVNIGSFSGVAALQLLFGYVLQRGWQGLYHAGMMIYPLQSYLGAFSLCFVFVLISFGFTLVLQDKRPASLQPFRIEAKQQPGV
ncbi:MAG: MFS transporter [Bacillota bacterium]